jgi:hypothetical protein
MPEVEPITPAETKSAPHGPLGIFGASNCERIDLRYVVTRDKFDLPKFLAFFKETEEHLVSKFVVCRTLEPKKLDYHLHFRWYFTKEVLTFYVSFHTGTFDKTEGEHEPYAEQFMSWLGAFFSNETAHADLHAEFGYPLETRQSRFPLPLKVNISDDLESEIDGISMSFASMPDGITNAEVKQGKKRLAVELLGTTRTKFADFDVQNEVSRLSPVALRLTETKDTK